MRAFRSVILVCSFLAANLLAFGQSSNSQPVKSQEVSSDDGLPVIIKHLPEWNTVKDKAVFSTNSEGLRNALGDRPVLAAIDFAGGTEAVTAPYPAGKLLIVEYTNPQASAEADTKFTQLLAANEAERSTVYRRIGNYNAFVFDTSDPVAANAVLDEIKYQKVVQWLGEDPYLLKKLEKYFVTTTRDIFISTVLWIVSGIGLALVSGVVVGFFFFRFRENKRKTRTAYSDAGGLTRLNLDGLSE